MLPEGGDDGWPAVAVEVFDVAVLAAALLVDHDVLSKGGDDVLASVTVETSSVVFVLLYVLRAVLSVVDDEVLSATADVVAAAVVLIVGHAVVSMGSILGVVDGWVVEVVIPVSVKSFDCDELSDGHGDVQSVTVGRSG